MSSHPPSSYPESLSCPENPLHPETLLCQRGGDAFGAVVPPIYQNSLFTFESWEAIATAFEDKINTPIYSRGHNPTVVEAERVLAAFAGAEKAKLFASGMAAISAGILHFLQPGCHVICVRNAYGPVLALLEQYLLPKFNIEQSFVGGAEVEEFAACIRDNTRLIYLESPASGLFGLQDLAAIAALAKAHGIATMVDNTWATPLFQRPLALGIDLEVHSCSKYLGGHSDIIAGVLLGSAALLDAIHSREFELLGARIAPMEAWFLLRSLRTLPLRMARHQQSALAVASMLAAHPKVARVDYPGLAGFPQAELARRQMSGFSGLMGFRLKASLKAGLKAGLGDGADGMGTDVRDAEAAARRFVNALKLIRIGVSWGGHESLIYAPAIGYQKELDPERFAALGLSPAQMRLSVGLEHVGDLIADLQQALEKV
ncbi:aminotransferase class I/II-fold pyridoxal phosphate-dependent enzyme [Shewanella cyperi]|uniref:Aminotransferase class I/II-fold pyridoxal phosphate-dependent enzyme n=1 Tax=Shewanella cyperi TaxID=2814292 RepID=A0A975ALQ3_9GAMM|nr:aminotransferase class I/II-fold pyridoxal phosphate-dependent enzyme [Shewanella cyperi]QSX30632.1 aminotransferase class I/II-fold pyridoxal phosphate-dependent enzyme [Shewanella cyperi]